MAWSLFLSIKSYWNRKTEQDNGVERFIWMCPLNQGGCWEVS